LAALALLAIVGGGWGWWHLRHWAPPRASFPVQGVEIGQDDGTPDWPAIKAVGADFAYLDASAGSFARDPGFTRNLEDARAAGLQLGAVHRYDPCEPADRQAGNFFTVVPRDARLLPPAVELVRLADQCTVHVSDAAVESELMTFLNQIEAHTGKATLLKIGPEFEKRYHIAHALDRKLWLLGDRFEPDYAGRPWTLWTANHALDSSASDTPLRWVVVQP
jgi:lysozyme